MHLPTTVTSFLSYKQIHFGNHKSCLCITAVLPVAVFIDFITDNSCPVLWNHAKCWSSTNADLFQPFCLNNVVKDQSSAKGFPFLLSDIREKNGENDFCSSWVGKTETIVGVFTACALNSIHAQGQSGTLESRSWVSVPPMNEFHSNLQILQKLYPLHRHCLS